MVFVCHLAKLPPKLLLFIFELKLDLLYDFIVTDVSISIRFCMFWRLDLYNAVQEDYRNKIVFEILNWSCVRLSTEYERRQSSRLLRMGLYH